MGSGIPHNSLKNLFMCATNVLNFAVCIISIAHWSYAKGRWDVKLTMKRAMTDEQKGFVLADKS